MMRTAKRRIARRVGFVKCRIPCKELNPVRPMVVVMKYMLVMTQMVIIFQTELMNIP